MMFHWLGSRQLFRPIERFHPYAVYELFGIPAGRWLASLVGQSEANDDERLAIRRYAGARPPDGRPLSES